MDCWRDVYLLATTNDVAQECWVSPSVVDERWHFVQASGLFVHKVPTALWYHECKLGVIIRIEPMERPTNVRTCVWGGVKIQEHACRVLRVWCSSMPHVVVEEENVTRIQCDD